MYVSMKRRYFRNESDITFFSGFMKVSEILSIFYIQTRYICMVQFGLFEYEINLGKKNLTWCK